MPATIETTSVTQDLEQILRKIAEPIRASVEAGVRANYQKWVKLHAELVEQTRVAREAIKAVKGESYSFWGMNDPGYSAYDLAKQYLMPKERKYWNRTDYSTHRSVQTILSFLSEGVTEGKYSTTLLGSTIRGDVQGRIEASAKAQGEAAITSFLAKSLAKFGGIIEAKGGTCKVAAWGTYDIAFTFDDGAHFRVTNSHILNVSVLGKVFSQFPTRFHNVLLADGSTVKNPSEKKLKTIFGNTRVSIKHA